MIDRYAYSNGLNDVHPGEKLALAISCMVVCLIGKSFFATSLTFLLMSALTVLKGRLPLAFYLNTLAMPLSFALVGSLTAMVGTLNAGESSLWCFTLWGAKMGITPAGLREGAHLLMKAFSCLSCLYMFALTTPMADTLALLRGLGVPALLVELTGLTYRFIFVYTETASAIAMAQSSRLGYSSIKNAYRAMGLLVSNLAIRSLNHSRELTLSLDARGYDGELRVLQRHYSLSPGRVAAIAAITAAVALAAFIEGNRFI